MIRIGCVIRPSAVRNVPIQPNQVAMYAMAGVLTGQDLNFGKIYHATKKEGEGEKRGRKREEKGKGWRVWDRDLLFELYYEKCSKI